MKHRNIFFAAFLVLLQFCSHHLWARPTTEYDAGLAVTGWLKGHTKSLGTQLGGQVSGVEAFYDDEGKPTYYIVYLEPAGYAVVPADDLVEPIIGFVDRGPFDPSPDNPLGALVSRDVEGRLVAARRPGGAARTASQTQISSAQAKWQELKWLAEQTRETISVSGLARAADTRVEPLTKTKWGQNTCCESPALACYNYYTPKWIRGQVPWTGHIEWKAGDPANYDSGCVATAMAQLLCYHRYPVLGVGAKKLTIAVEGQSAQAATRGGDGSGGPYDWSAMVLEPDCSTTAAQRGAIGALCYDAGVSVEMVYEFGGSGAYVSDAADALKDLFMYSNAVKGSNNEKNIGSGLIAMINPNLDANCPVILGIWGGAGPHSYGHAIVVDGYGYDGYSTLYHHLNMGFSGIYDAWYNLPSVDSEPPFDSATKCIYNIFTSGSGEVISGRVTDELGQPIKDVTVTANGLGGPYIATTNAKGIYALVKVKPNSTYIIGLAKTGYTFESRAVKTGESLDDNLVSGNRWAIDFVGIPDCFPNANPKYNEWVTVGKPQCWCYLRQCYGDADGKAQGSAKTGIYNVGTNDLNVLIAAWQVKEPPIGPGIASIPNGICADFAHDAQGSAKTGLVRVSTNDLRILIVNWLVKEPPVGKGVPDDCLK